MDLHDFGHQMRDKVRSFEKYWREAHKDSPEDFPMDADEPEWFEQFDLYLGA